MPLRDHFRPPLDNLTSWEGFHGQWPASIVRQLNVILPPEFVAEPRIHLGSAFEIDVSAYEKDAAKSWERPAENGNGSVSISTWSPSEPVLLLDAEERTPSEYEVLVYDVSRRRRLVAAIEIISPGNKDRPESRDDFVHKCESLLYQGVCVVIVDLVTIRSANLYRQLAEVIGAAEQATLQSPIYAAVCRRLRRPNRVRVEAWEHELVIGQPLPTLPLWLTESIYVSLDLETSYEETCRELRIP